MRLRNQFVVIFILTAPAVSAASQPLYPAVTQEAQQQRDKDRRLILEAELRTEREGLAKAQTAFIATPSAENGAFVHRHSENIKALERELNRTMRVLTPDVPRVVVKAKRPEGNDQVLAGRKVATFWDPYNRAADSNNFSTIQRSDTP